MKAISASETSLNVTLPPIQRVAVEGVRCEHVTWICARVVAVGADRVETLIECTAMRFITGNPTSGDSITNSFYVNIGLACNVTSSAARGPHSSRRKRFIMRVWARNSYREHVYTRPVSLPPEEPPGSWMVGRNSLAWSYFTALSGSTTGVGKLRTAAWIRPAGLLWKFICNIYIFNLNRHSVNFIKDCSKVSFYKGC